MLTFKVSEDEAGKRADIVVTGHLLAYSRSSLKQLFSKGLILIDGLPIKASHKLEPGELVQTDISLLKTEPDKIEIPVIYEDENIVVMNKPAGILTHSKGAINSEATVASFIKNKLNDPYLSGNRAGIVHRLDRATSGVIIAAKNNKTLKWLQKQFSTHKVKKLYLAIVEGIPIQQAAIIDAPLERNPKRPQTFRVGNGGKPSQTRYKVLGKSVIDGSSNSYSLLELYPQTGRTHQLRVHLKYIGHPIVGDRVYGHAGDNLYLHASSLELTMPSGDKMKFLVPKPSIFKEFTKL